MLFLYKNYHILTRVGALLALAVTLLLVYLTELPTAILGAVLVGVAAVTVLPPALLAQMGLKRALASLAAQDPEPLYTFTACFSSRSVIHRFNYAMMLYEMGKEEEAYSLLCGEKLLPRDFLSYYACHNTVFIAKTVEEKSFYLAHLRELGETGGVASKDMGRYKSAMTLCEADLLYAKGEYNEALALLAPLGEEMGEAVLLTVKCKLALGEPLDREALEELAQKLPKMHAGREAARLLAEEGAET